MGRIVEEAKKRRKKNLLAYINKWHTANVSKFYSFILFHFVTNFKKNMDLKPLEKGKDKCRL